MNSSKLPSVLHAPPNTISMERALKQILELLNNYPTDPCLTDVEEDKITDRVNASLDDIKTMLAALDRSE